MLLLFGGYVRDLCTFHAHVVYPNGKHEENRYKNNSKLQKNVSLLLNAVSRMRFFLNLPVRLRY